MPRPLIYIVAGPMRTGKSEAARRFNALSGVSYISTDDLLQMLGLAAPELGMGWDSGSTWRQNRERISPFLLELARARVHDGNPLLIEGEIEPELAAALRAELGDRARICFVGSAELDLESKVSALRRWSQREGDWLTEGPDDLTEWAARESLAASIEYRAAANEVRIAYFELSGDFEAALGRLIEFLAS